MLSENFLSDMLDFLKTEPNPAKIDYQKKLLAKKYSMKSTPSNIAILSHLDTDTLSWAKKYLLTKPMRTGSGVTPVAVMTKPMRCPHGKCTYCPGGPDSYYGDVPQSYTGHEPATMRGIRAGYDAYIQVFNRLEQFVLLGQSPEKVECILMGGTLPSYPKEYQDEVIRDVFKAMNDFSSYFFKDGIFQFDVFKEFFELPGTIGSADREARVQQKVLKLKEQDYDTPIAQLQEQNENVKIRCVGLTIETRPSHAGGEIALKMLEQGCTRVELGIQTTFDEVLEKVHRDHSVQESIDAIADLRDLGFKLNFHMMLGLPLMTPERDEEAITRIFSDPDFKPDMIKIYPCMVMPGTPLFYEYKRGTYKPYSTEQTAELIAKWAPLFPEWVRVMRVQRDIPTKMTEAGVDKTNLRQYVDKQSLEQKTSFRDIRAREIKDRPIGEWAIEVIEFEAANGKEFFIQAVESATNALIGFCRLRFPSRQLHPEITPSSAIVRELHVYGKALNIGKQGDQQHKGFGKVLMEKAEEICREGGKDKLLVISGVGVRQYYKQKLGYEQMGPYVGKML